jgi:hypothetical protein
MTSIEPGSVIRRICNMYMDHARVLLPAAAVVFAPIGILSAILIAASLAANSAGTGLGLAVRVIMGIFTAPLAALAAAVLYFALRTVASGASGPSRGSNPLEEDSEPRVSA